MSPHEQLLAAYELHRDRLAAAKAQQEAQALAMSAADQNFVHDFARNQGGRELIDYMLNVVDSEIHALIKQHPQLAERN